MKFAEAWRLSRTPYKEVVYQSLAEEKGRMWWGAFGRGNAGREAQSDLELTKRALRIAKFDKTLLSVFNVVVAIVPFAASFLGTQAFGLASSVSLSLVVTFGFTMLYAVQTLSSFVGAESTLLLSILPVDRHDYSLITLFSFTRSVDYMVAGSILSQIVAVASITGSPAATAIMAAAAMMNELFAVSIALWFSRLFQKNLLQGGKSKVKSLIRFTFIFLWSILLVGVGFLFSVPWYLMPNLERALIGAGTLSNLLLSFLYPFSAGILVEGVTFSNVAVVPILLSAIVLLLYGFCAIFAGKWSLATVKKISQGAGLKIGRIVAGNFSIRTRGKLFGYVLKDLRVASRNPATAFFFALPVLETVITVFLNFGTEMLKTTVVLVAAFMGGVFALFVPLALLTAEGKGLEFTKTLPISSRRIIISKTFLSTATYVFVPFALLGFSLVKPLSSITSALIPFLITVSVACASVFEIKLFFKTIAKGRIAAILNDAQKLVAGILTIIIPEFAYAATFLISINHTLSTVAMGVAVVAEFAFAAYVLKKS